jgi:uncharacterized protein
MKRKTGWKLSHYTSVIRDSDSGDILLHNSFMGAIALVPAHKAKNIEKFLSHEINGSDLTDEGFQELCEAAFFVPSNINERQLVSKIIDKERELGFQIIILPHENCNFRCVYCYEKFERDKIEPDVVVGLKAFVARKVQEVKSLSISWFGGEPLLALDSICDLSDSFLHSCEQYGVTYTSDITTNGYLLTDEIVDSLLKRKVTSYQVTLDGPEDIHNRSRKLAGGGETYRTILDNLSRMRDRSETFSVSIRVNFREEHTASPMEQFMHEVQTLFEGDTRFNLAFHPVGRMGGPNDPDLDICDFKSQGTFRTAFSKRSLELGFSDDLIKQGLQPHGNVCYAGRESSIVVGSDGTVYKCTVAFDDARNHVGRITRVGELLVNQARWDLWTKLDDKEVGKCTSCSYSPSCQSRGCPLGAIVDKIPPCPMTRDEYEAMVKLVALNGTTRT